MKKLWCILGIVLFTGNLYALGGPDLEAYENIAIQHQSKALVETDDLLLSPQTPKKNIWLMDENDSYYGCPFFSTRECDIWKRKPTVIETIDFPERRIKKTGDYKKQLLERYQTLMHAARSCCVAGMEYRLKQSGASKRLVYKFMIDDANFYRFGDRCLMMSDEKLETTYPNSATAQMVSDVRDTCLCRRRDYFAALIAPFDDFTNEEYEYSYQDGLKRDLNVSITEDVNFIKEQLETCPK